ncbi:thioesterase domain-containing protein [Paragemmobacter aquarius]|nr:alpha/beta fold hydrolase [Gemmobacter aquarius]
MGDGMAGATIVAKTDAGGGFARRDDLRLPYAFVPAGTALEAKVADVFGAVLRVAGVGVVDDFFDLGGDSLGGEQIALEIERRTGKPFAISALFDCPTPRLIAAYLQRAGVAKGGQDATRIFVVHGRGGYTVLRPEFRAGLTRGAEITMFELPGIRGDAPVPETVADVAAAYVDQIGRDYPQGPIRLAAFCAGGLIALEMAAQLKRAGRPVAGLVLIDPSVPSRLRKRHRMLARIEAGGDRLRLAYGVRFGDGAALPAPLGALARLVRRVEYRLRLWAILLRENWFDRLRGGGGLARYRNAALKALPRAKLITAYRFAWPEPFDGPVGVIASQERGPAFGKAGGIWRRFLPQAEVVTVAVSHADIGKGSAAEVADRMEAMLLSPEALARAG